MDPMTASYYRAILFRDSQDQRPIPPTLVLLHAWAFKRFQAMGAGSIISKQAALCVATTWIASTKEGRKFARDFTDIGDLFCEPEEESRTESDQQIDWDAVPQNAKVLVDFGDKSAPGEFIGRRGAWVDVKIGSETKPVRPSQVRIVGA